jgi:hypothetical protein
MIFLVYFPSCYRHRNLTHIVNSKVTWVLLSSTNTTTTSLSANIKDRLWHLALRTPTMANEAPAGQDQISLPGPLPLQQTPSRVRTSMDT